MLSTFEIPLTQLNSQLNEISDFIDSIRSTKISRSTVSYNAVIISLYGCYENYVNSLAEELISQISNNSSNYAEIPTNMIISNIHLSSDFLKSKQRYKNFNLKNEDVINNIYSGKMTNKLLLKHGGNLSIAVLSEYFKNLGIKDVVQQIKNNNKFCQYYSEIKTISIDNAKSYLHEPDIIFPYLGDLIFQRNTIAHSWKSDDKVDYSIIKDEWIKFIRIFCECLYDAVVSFYSQWLVKCKKLFCPKGFKIYGSSVVGFFDVQSYCQDNNKTVIIVVNEKIHVCKILNVKTHENYKVSMKIEGYSLKKEQSEKYSFYFDKTFLKKSTND